MDFYQIINNRRTIHHYKPEPLPQEVLHRVLKAAHMAPNHKMTWPWRFTLVGPETRQTLVPLAHKIKEQKKGPLTEIAKKALQSKLLNPGALVVVSILRTDNNFQYREDYAAASCAIQNMLLALQAEGYGGKWGSGGLTSHPETYKMMDIAPEQEEIIAFIWMGTPSQIPEVQRPALAHHLRHIR